MGRTTFSALACKGSIAVSNLNRSFVVSSGTGVGLLSLGTAEFAGLENGGSGGLDVLLGGNTDHEGGDVDHLLADSNVSLSDEDTGVMHGLGLLLLDDEGLESSLHELGDGQTKDVIEFALGLLEETKLDHASNKGLT